MTPADPGAVEARIAEHVWDHSRGECACGWTPTYPDCYAPDDPEVELSQHHAHVAAVLAPLVAAEVARERAAIAAGLERLRLGNPMNGDGANYMLDKAIATLTTRGGDEVTEALSAERERRRVREEDDYRRIQELNRREGGQR